MRPFFLRADDLLRGADWATRSARPWRVLLHLLALILLFGLGYGAVMGCFSGLHPDRLRQVLYSALKVPLLLLGTFLLTIPSFFVLNTLAGVREDFTEAMRALMATQAGLTVILAALAPFTALWYLSSADYEAAILFNAFMFAVASLSAQMLLRHFYRPLIRRNPRHRQLLVAWLVVYAFVGIQMGWLMRPFVGAPGSPTTFFRAGMWGNAYEVVARLIWENIPH